MGKPPSLSHHRGLRAGCDFLSQTKASLWHLSADSCVAQLLSSWTQGRCQFGEGREHGHMYPHSIPLLTHTTPVHEMPPVAHPTPTGPPCTPELWEQDPHPTWPHHPSHMYLSCQDCCQSPQAPLPSQGGARMRGYLEGDGDPCT